MKQNPTCASYEGVWRGRGVAPLVINFGTKWSPDSCSGCFTIMDGVPITHWIWGWVNFSFVWNFEELPSLFDESNQDSSIFLRVTQPIMMVSVYWGRISSQQQKQKQQQQHRTALQASKELDLGGGTRRRPEHNSLDFCKILTTVYSI